MKQLPSNAQGRDGGKGLRMKVGVVSLGCVKNQVDTEQMLSLLLGEGYEWTANASEAEVILVNTCGFITSAKEQSIDVILNMARYKTEGRCRLLVVTGCLSQRYPKNLLDQIPEIDILMGVNQYAELPAAIERALRAERPCLCEDNYTYFEHERYLSPSSPTAYIRIGEGCSNRCTFCAIPLIRGPYRSRDEEAILREIRSLAAAGVREHILVAQDTTRYGTENHPHTTLPDLMRKAASVDGVDWLRVLYCYPDETSEELLDVLADVDHICPYLDIPIQHINADLLRRMHRRGTREDILRCVRGARQRGLTLRTTLIVGFPGETEDQFKELLDFVEETEFDRLGAFIFSPEDGTPAAKMPHRVPPSVQRRRLDQLMTLQQKISLKRNQSRIGSVEQVLITEADDHGNAVGRSSREIPESDGEIYLSCGQARPKPGLFIPVKITDAEEYDLRGIML